MSGFELHWNPDFCVMFLTGIAGQAEHRSKRSQSDAIGCSAWIGPTQSSEGDDFSAHL